jgi:2,3-diketo-5-methylthio-1-phosphopentane phosphatase
MTKLSSGTNGRGIPAEVPGIPERLSSQVWIDFDGTISVQDVLDELIRKHAKNDSWRAIEEQWMAGSIGSHQCLTEEFSLVRISAGELDELLGTIKVDPGFDPLVRLCRENDVPLTILSDGIGAFIRRVLRGHETEGYSVRANAVDHRGRTLGLQCPFSSAGCRSGAAHCKCDSVRTLGTVDRTSIYIGDGRSDLCPARSCGLVFAKGALAAALTAEGRPFVPFSDLGGVHDQLRKAWARGSASKGAQ